MTGSVLDAEAVGAGRRKMNCSRCLRSQLARPVRIPPASSVRMPAACIVSAATRDSDCLLLSQTMAGSAVLADEPAALSEADAKAALAALPELLARLRDIRNALPSASAGYIGPLGLQAPTLSLQALVQFIDRIDQAEQKRLTDPLWSLLAALGDLEQGTQSPMLTVVTRTKRYSTEYQMLTAKAAAVMDLMVAEGVKRDEAAKRTAAALRQAGYRFSTRSNARVDWRVVADWRDRLNGSAANTMGSFAARAWAEYLAIRIEGGAVTSETVAFFLSDLKEFVIGRPFLTPPT